MWIFQTSLTVQLYKHCNSKSARPELSLLWEPSELNLTLQWFSESTTNKQWTEVSLHADIDKSLDLEKFSLAHEKLIFMSRSPLDFKNRKKSFSFSSRLSRLEKNFSVCLRPISLSPLDFQDFWDQFLFLLSIFKILYNTFSFSSWFSRFKKIFFFS